MKLEYASNKACVLVKKNIVILPKGRTVSSSFNLKSLWTISYKTSRVMRFVFFLRLIRFFFANAVEQMNRKQGRLSTRIIIIIFLIMIMISFISHKRQESFGIKIYRYNIHHTKKFHSNNLNTILQYVVVTVTPKKHCH